MQNDNGQWKNASLGVVFQINVTTKCLQNDLTPPLLLNTMRQEHRCEINGAEQQSEGTVKSLLYNHNKEGGISDC